MMIRAFIAAILRDYSRPEPDEFGITAALNRRAAARPARQQAARDGARKARAQ